MLYSEILQKMEVASRYYSRTKPEKNYPKHQALKQFQQDKNIDLKVLKSVIREIAMDLIKETRDPNFE
jgi:hypothetical protein